MGRLRLAAGTAAIAFVAGCSLLLDTAEATQCSTQRDCESTSALRNRVCKEGFCVLPGADDLPPVSVDGGGTGCGTTELCTQANSGRISVCKSPGGSCTPWQTEQCSTVAGSIKDPEAVVIGSIFPLTAKQVSGEAIDYPYAQRLRNALSFAIKDFEKQLPGGAFAAGDGKQRPFAVIHCDSRQTAEGAMSAFQHLTEVVGVQAIVVGSDDDMAAIAAAATTKKTAIACSDCVAALPPGPLVWRIGPRIALEAPMIARRVLDHEAEIKALPSPPATVKVAVLKTPGRASDAFYEALAPILKFNGGKSLLANGADFTVIETDDARVKNVDHDKFATMVASFQPDILIVAMGDDFPLFYLPLIETKMAGAPRKPRYLTTSLNNDVTQFADRLTPELCTRVSGARPLYTPEFQANIDAFVARYLAPHNFVQPDGNWTGFEAGYSIALAALAARSQPIFDGPHISAGFERLRGGATKIDFRPDSIPLAFGLLGSPSVQLDVRGLWSDLDWNVTTRDFDSDVGTYCYYRDGLGNLLQRPNAGPSLDTKTGSFTGTFSCE